MKTDYKKFKEANERVAKAEAEAEESQKPSVIIRGIADRRDGYGSNTAEWALVLIDAILLYLDEQHDERKRD